MGTAAGLAQRNLYQAAGRALHTKLGGVQTESPERSGETESATACDWEEGETPGGRRKEDGALHTFCGGGYVSGR